MADKYYRLVCLVVNVCPEPLRELFLKLAKSDPSRPYIDLQAYLNLRQPKIAQLKRKKVIRDDQYELIFPQNGSPNTSTWDVTLLVTLIKNLFSVQPLEIVSMDEMRTVRNDLQHLPNTSSITDADFDSYWRRLDSAATFLARQVSGPAYETVIEEKIKQTRQNNMPNLGDALRYFYEENSKRNSREMATKMTVMGIKLREQTKKIQNQTKKIQNLQMTIQSLEAKTDSVATNSTQSNILLRNVTVSKTGPNGEKVKRFKTVDEILCRLLKRFYATMKTELPENFTPPAEIADVRSKLRESHHVIIAGSGNNLNLAIALCAINDIGYTYNRCVEMLDSLEWRHIDPDDVDLVLCRDPFGKPLYESKKALSMVDIFDSIYHAVRPRDGSKHLDFIIVTEVDCLTELKATRDHDLLEQVVMLSTSENHPIDLTAASYKSSEQFGHKVDFTRYMTQTILDNYSLYTTNIDPPKLKQARELLSKHRMVAITGPPHSGKTSTVVALAQAYTSNAVLFLCSPDDIRNIDPRTTLLVIIEDFGGKYLFDKMEVNKWLGVLDCLLKLVTAGKLQVVVTGEAEKLQSCIREIAPHPLLLNPVILTRRQMHMHIKQESSEIDENQCEHSSNNVRKSLTQDPRTTTALHTGRELSTSLLPYMKSGHVTANTIPLNLTTTSVLHEKRGIWTSLIPSKDNTKKSGHVTGLQVVRSVQSVRRYNVRIDRDEDCCSTYGCCMLPGGEILLADCWNKTLKKLDSAYNVISVCDDLSVYPWAVCYIGNNVAVVAAYYQLMYVDVSSMTVRNIVTTDHCCYSITCHNDKLYVTSKDTVYMYTLDGNNRSTLYKLKNNSFCITGIAVSGDGKRIYITDGNTRLIKIDCLGNLLNSLTLPDARAVCVDDRDNVWVGSWSEKLYQVSGDGARLLDTISVDELYNTRALCYDRDRSSLIAAGINYNIHVVKLD